MNTKHSPLIIEIILHYYCNLGGDMGVIHSPAGKDAVTYLLSEEMLIKSPKGLTDREQLYIINRNKAKVYVDAICNVPFPVQKYVIPEDE